MTASHSFDTIGIIGGTGREGRGLALRLAGAGVCVVVGSRDLKRARVAVAELQAQTGERRLEAADNGRAASCEVVILSVPFEHAAATLAECNGRLRRGALLLDVTVPVRFGKSGPELVEVPEGSAAEHVRARVPSAVRVAGAFKVLPADLLHHLATPFDCDDFVCGDSADARTRAMAVSALVPGLRPIDVGGLKAARALERMTVLAIQLNRRYHVHHTRYRLVGI